ncbi:MAG TPA: hypothetical protein PLR11_01865, partial [Candidatus Paceibacterota bacterium]|nr:hypothetical protein [Candidatus Paceibacterota bacterium]
MENIKIVFENKDFLVINKPAGLLVHGVNYKSTHEYFHESIHENIHEQKTLVDWLIKRYPKIIDV